MTIATAFLVLLEGRPQHGYDLKRAYDQHFGHDRPVHYGQVYAALAKLLRNGLGTVDGVGGESGPDRKRYTITDAGVTDLQRWLAEPEKPEQYLQSKLYAKVIGQPALMKQLTRVGLHSRTLMEWMLRIMANLLRPDETGPAEAAYKAAAALVRLAPNA